MVGVLEMTKPKSKPKKSAPKKGVHTKHSPKEKKPAPAIADAYKEIMGRPDDYTPETAAMVCAYMMEGETLLTISKREGMPSKSAVLRWLPKYPEFRDHYARASEVRAGIFIEESIDIVDDGSNDWMEINSPTNVGWRENGEAIQRSKLRVDFRKWMATKLLPKMYGDKTTLVHETPDTSHLTMEEIEAGLAFMAKLSKSKQP